MPDVLFSNEDITVLGPPEIVELLVDIGPTGIRGSQIFVGVGNPNTTTIGQIPLQNDIYINASPGVDYSYLYQYKTQPGGLTWVKVLKINPVIYNKLYTTTYNISGDATIAVPIADIVSTPTETLQPNNFSIQYSIVNDNVVSSSISSVLIVGSDLVINFKGLEYSGSWQVLTGEVTTHLFISIVPSTVV